jgi:predicted flavoprotein YhiN
MESKKCGNLFFAGEVIFRNHIDFSFLFDCHFTKIISQVLNVDGITGGFNFQVRSILVFLDASIKLIIYF